jgi:hypothetical protein
MIGTNDARKGKLTKASKNLEQLSKKLSENTIYVNIPPIEIGAPGDDEYEDAAATRTLINNMINNKFPQTVRMNTMANIQRTEKNILEERDGYHLTAKGGQMIAKLIATAVEKNRITTHLSIEAETNNRSPTHKQKEQQNDNEPTKHLNSEQNQSDSDDLTFEETRIMVIPDGIGAHIVGKKGKQYWK